MEEDGERPMRRMTATACALAMSACAFAQDYPVRPIRLVATEAGGAIDFQARLIGQVLAVSLGEPVVVDNRVTPLAIQTVAKSAPDGYTLMVNSNTMWVEPLLRKTPYDPVRDFAPITLATRSPLILVVQPALPAKSVSELIALARAKPGSLNYSSGPTGGSNHLAAEMFKSMAGLDIVRITYKGGGIAANAVIGGEVQMLFSLAATATPLVKSGRLRALAVTGARPSPVAPGLPPVAATLPGFEWLTLTGLFAPAKTPQPIVNRVHQQAMQALSQPEVKEKLLAAGIETIGGSPVEMGAAIKSEMARIGQLIKDAGIHAD
jgi:tripartite-type tricarboxylate transporter receptor subunit TctC